MNDAIAREVVRPGDRIADKYRVDGFLGAGGMGVVVAATHEQLDQRVAIKLLLPEVASRPEIVARFLREARAAVRIRSEHVARVLDVGTMANGAPFMVMEFLEGMDLERHLESTGPLPVRDAVSYVLEACEALAEAHALGIVHRDLKPANLFLARGPGGATVKVLDFGISKIPLSGKEAALTQESAIVGSPTYMSPEQLRAARDVDARSDVYSLGVVLFQLLSGKTPFNATTMAALVALVLIEPPPPVTTLRADVPEGLAAVIARALEKDPANRFPDIVALSGALLPFATARGAQSMDRIEHAMGRSSADRTFEPGFLPLAPAHVTGATGPTIRPFSTTIRATTSKRTMWAVGVSVVTLGVAIGAGLFLALPKSSGSSGSSGVSGTSAVVAAQAEPKPAPEPPPVASTVASASTVAGTGTSTSSTAIAPSAPTVEAASSPRPPTLVAAHASTNASTASPKPSASASSACKVVSFFDADGNKHFKQECK